MFEPAPLVVEAPGDVDLLRRAADRAAEAWDLDPPVLVRVGANGVFTSGNVILRVGVATAPMGVAIALADRLLADGIRVAAPARRDWLTFDDRLSVTAWERIDFDPSLPVDWELVGRTVARVHAIDPTTIDHPLPFCADFPWWNLADAMGEADVADERARAGLIRAAHDNRWWIDTTRSRPLTLCHGDVHPGNVLVDASGPVLIDWDLLCVGPAEWDHSALRTWTERWGGEPGLYEAFLAGYGLPIDDEIADAIAEMRLLVATLMRLKRARLDPVHGEEAFRRLAYWRGDADAPVWRPQ